MIFHCLICWLRYCKHLMNNNIHKTEFFRNTDGLSSGISNVLWDLNLRYFLDSSHHLLTYHQKISIDLHQHETNKSFHSPFKKLNSSEIAPGFCCDWSLLELFVDDSCSISLSSFFSSISNFFFSISIFFNSSSEVWSELEQEILVKNKTEKTAKKRKLHTLKIN